MELVISSWTDISLLLLSLALWSAAYYHSNLSPHNPASNPRGFEQSKFISNLHSIPLVLLSIASILEFIPEKYPVIYSVGFFVVDLVDCFIRGDTTFFIHAVLTLGMKFGAYSSVDHRQLRSISKVFLAESSTVRSCWLRWFSFSSLTQAAFYWKTCLWCRILLGKAISQPLEVDKNKTWFSLFLYCFYSCSCHLGSLLYTRSLYNSHSRKRRHLLAVYGIHYFAIDLVCKNVQYVIELQGSPKSFGRKWRWHWAWC